MCVRGDAAHELKGDGALQDAVEVEALGELRREKALARACRAADQHNQRDAVVVKPTVGSRD